MSNKISQKGTAPSGASRLGVPSSLDSTVTSYNKFTVVDGNITVPVNYSYKKVIKTGKHIEIHIAEKPYILDRRVSTLNRTQNTKKERTKEYRKRTVKRAMDTIRRLAKGNFNPEYVKHMVLTFSNDVPFDISDIAVCNKYFSKFVQRLRSYDKDFKYIEVPEYHKNRDAIHFHVMSDIRYIPQDELQEIWGYGIVHIKKAPIDIAAYLFKYLTKNANDKRFIGKRTWSHSKNMQPSIYLYGKGALLQIDKLTLEQSKPTYHYKYLSEYNGMIEVYEFTNT